MANTQATAVPLPKTLGGVTVTVDGAEAPIYFVSATQGNFLIPGAAPQGLKDVQIRTAGGTSHELPQAMAALREHDHYTQDVIVPRLRANLR